MKTRKKKTIKIRRQWEINPVTRIKDSKKKYNRREIKKIELE